MIHGWCFIILLVAGGYEIRPLTSRWVGVKNPGIVNAQCALLYVCIFVPLIVFRCSVHFDG